MVGHTIRHQEESHGKVIEGIQERENGHQGDFAINLLNE